MAKAELRWEEKDVSTLFSVYMNSTASELTAMFPTRSIDAIRKKARKCGLHVPPDMEFANRSEARSGEKAPNWHGGKKVSAKGYVLRLCKGHPRANPNGYVLEHILVWEAETKMAVPDGFVVHHLDGDKQNNVISNLCLMPFGAHTAFHNKQRKKENQC